MDIISDRKESSDEEKDDDNGGFIPIEILVAVIDAKAKAKAFAKAMAEANTMAMATKVAVRHKRKFIALSSNSEEQNKPGQDEAEESPLITRRFRRTSYAKRRPRKSL
jgi:hypothetical protein